MGVDFRGGTIISIKVIQHKKEIKMKVKIATSDEKARHFGMFGIARMATAIGMVGLSGIALGGGASAMRISDGLRVNPDYEKYVQDVKAGNGSNWNLILE